MSQTTGTNNNTKQDNSLGLDQKATMTAKGETFEKVLTAAGLTTLMGTGVPMSTVQEELVVNVNTDWIQSVAQSLIDSAYMYDNRIDDELTVERLSLYLEWVFVNRINYLHRGTNVVHPRSVQYPTVIYDALARLTRYDGAKTDGALIIPRPPFQADDEVESDATETEQAGPDQISECGVRTQELPQTVGVDTHKWLSGNRILAFPDHDKFAAKMKIAGIQLATGIPMTRNSEVRTMFEMNVNPCGHITTAGKVPSIQDVFARCFYDFVALSSLVGVQKTELLLYSTLKSKLLDVTNGYVTNYRAGN